jgi:FixJ family two-component response regulator
VTDNPAGITPREFEAFRRACRGATNVEIAKAMGIAQQTVKNYLSLVYCKLTDAGIGVRVSSPGRYYSYLMGLADGVQAQRENDALE